MLRIVESAAGDSGKLWSSRVSDGWWRQFKERQGDLSLRQGDSTAHVRMDALNQETIDHYFTLLRETLTTHDLLNKPSQIYNMDETGVPLNPRPPKIVTTKGRVLLAPSASTPSGPKKAPPRARLLTSTAALEMLQEKEKKKKEEAELKEQKKKEREDNKRKREEERKRKANERARRAEERANDKSKKVAQKARKQKEKVQLPTSKGNPNTSTSSTRRSSQTKKARVAEETIDDSRCCACFITYEDDVLNKTGKDWVGCACGRCMAPRRVYGGLCSG